MRTAWDGKEEALIRGRSGFLIPDQWSTSIPSLSAACFVLSFFLPPRPLLSGGGFLPSLQASPFFPRLSRTRCMYFWLRVLCASFEWTTGGCRRSSGVSACKSLKDCVSSVFRDLANDLPSLAARVMRPALREEEEEVGGEAADWRLVLSAVARPDVSCITSLLPSSLQRHSLPCFQVWAAVAFSQTVSLRIRNDFSMFRFASSICS